MNGETETGVTTFFLEKTVDTGKIILQARTPIGPDDDAGSLHDRLSLLGANVVLETVRLIETGEAKSVTQDNALTSPAPKISKEDCRIRWDWPAMRVRNFIRGLSPSPSAWTLYRGKVMKLFRVEIDQRPASGQAGELFVDPPTFLISTGDSCLSIEDLQLEGRKRMHREEFLRGYRLKTGEVFGD